MDEGRIKLAEAMGWRPGWAGGHVSKDKGEPPNIWSPPGTEFSSCWHSVEDLPDPFTDANDDYAVLEWARNSWLTRNPPHPDRPEWNAFCDALWEIPTLYGSLLFYKVGDYARAALKVLEGVPETNA